MVRLFLYFIGLAGLTAFLAWLADQPGAMVVTFGDREIQTSVFFAVVAMLALVALAVLAWTLLRGLISTPGAMARLSTKRRQKQGMEALSSGMIAVGAGDKALATRFALQAARSLPNEPMTDLLRAQTAQLLGDRSTARRIYEAMLNSPETEMLGLRGLFLEAEREKEQGAAQQFAQRALTRNPKLGWANTALFEVQCRRSDWAGALETLATARRHDVVPKKIAERRRAILLTAQAQELEDSQPDKAQTLAGEAHDLAPDLVPAAEIAARIHAARGRMQKAATIIEQTWKRCPHPDLALVYAHARTGDSPRDRLSRLQKLSALAPGHRESKIAIANAAIDARDWDLARQTLEPLLEDGLSQRICVLMARIEGGDRGDTGRVREWLARAVHAPRDPSWTADGHVSDRWAAVSPVTGKLDAYEWTVAEARRVGSEERLLLEELVAAGDRGVATQIAEQIAKITADLKAEQSAGLAAARADIRAAASDAVPATMAQPPVLAITSGPNAEPSRRPANDGGQADAAMATKRNGEVPHYVKSGHAPDDPGPDVKAAQAS
jgi:HemY protein